MGKRTEFTCQYCGRESECPYYKSQASCRIDRHHLYWEKRWYTTPLEQKFRGLKKNLRRQCRGYHDYIHATQTPPPKPSERRMFNAIKAEERKAKGPCRTAIKQWCHGIAVAYNSGLV